MFKRRHHPYVTEPGQGSPLPPEKQPRGRGAHRPQPEDPGVSSTWTATSRHFWTWSFSLEFPNTHKASLNQPVLPPQVFCICELAYTLMCICNPEISGVFTVIHAHAQSGQKCVPSTPAPRWGPRPRPAPPHGLQQHVRASLGNGLFERAAGIELKGCLVSPSARRLCRVSSMCIREPSFRREA